MPLTYSAEVFGKPGGTMTKRKRRALIWTGSIVGVFAVLAIALLIFISTLDQNKAKKYISAGVHTATGRQLSINGDIRLDLGWVSRLSASEIQFQNVGWSKHPQMAEIGLFDLQIDLWQLVRHFRVVLPTVTISQPKVVLEKNAEGSANWEFRAAPAVTEPVVPENRSSFPVIEKVIIKDGTLLFDDQESKTQIELKVTAEGAGFLEAPVKLKLVPPAKGEMLCQAWVTFTGSTALKVQVREPKLQLQVRAPEKAVIGDPVNVVLAVSNPGDHPAILHVLSKASPPFEVPPFKP